MNSVNFQVPLILGISRVAAQLVASGVLLSFIYIYIYIYICVCVCVCVRVCVCVCVYEHHFL
jgi:hypothetical protein